MRGKVGKVVQGIEGVKVIDCHASIQEGTALSWPRRLHQHNKGMWRGREGEREEISEREDDDEERGLREETKGMRKDGKTDGGRGGREMGELGD